MGILGEPGRNCKPISLTDRAAATPSAAASPKTEPPASTTACARPTRFSGDRASVSRPPGPPPRTSTPAGHAAAHSTVVTPDLAFSSVACPTLRPAISVIRFLRAGRNMRCLTRLRRDDRQSLQDQIRHDFAARAHGARDHAGVAPGDEQFGLFAGALLDYFGRPVSQPCQSENGAARHGAD